MDKVLSLLRSFLVTSRKMTLQRRIQVSELKTYHLTSCCRESLVRCDTCLHGYCASSQRPTADSSRCSTSAFEPRRPEVHFKWLKCHFKQTSDCFYLEQQHDGANIDFRCRIVKTHLIKIENKPLTIYGGLWRKQQDITIFKLSFSIYRQNFSCSCAVDNGAPSYYM